MSWRRCWISRRSIPNHSLHKLRPFSLLHLPLPPPPPPPESSAPANSRQRPCFFSDKQKLTPDVVCSTLSSCGSDSESDLSALSFFLRCAKQRDYFHDRRSFQHMVPVVARLTNRYKTVGGIVTELERIGWPRKAQTFLLLLRIYWDGGFYGLVFHTYKLMKRVGFTPNTFARNVLIDVYFKKGCADVALKVLKQTQVPNFLSFNITLCHLCKLDDVANIKNIIQNMLRNRFYPNVSTLEMVLNVFCKRGRLVEASQVVTLIISLGVSPSVNAWSMLVHGFCRLQRFDMAVHLLEKMGENGCTPNVVTYTSLIKAFMESGRVLDALKTLSVMLKKGNAPDLVLNNVLVDCFCKNGQHDDAIRTFDSLSKQKLSPDSYTLSSLLTKLHSSKGLFLLSNLVSGSRLVFEDQVVSSSSLLQKLLHNPYTRSSLSMKLHLSKRKFLLHSLGSGRIFEDQVFYNSLMHHYCNVGLPFLAVYLYEYMVFRGHIPDNYRFAGVLSALCKLREIDNALNLYNGLVREVVDLDAHVHTTIMDGLIKVGRCHQAIELMGKIIRDEGEMDAIFYMVAIRGSVKGGRGYNVIALYDQMKEAGLSPDAPTYNVMVYGSCRNKDAKMVIKLLQEMIDSRIKLSFDNFIRIYNFFSRSHHSQLVVDILIKMRDLGLLPEEIASLRHGLVQDVCLVGNTKTLVLGSLTKRNSSLDDISSSEDMYDMAASVG